MAIYAIADLHGQYNLFQQVKEYIKPTDKVYVLGDCGDRGKEGWAIIKEVYQNPQFIYLKGNHEQMLAEAMQGDKSLCYMNGGKSTYAKWRYADGGKLFWVRRLLDLPLEAVYINKQGKRIVMCHSGYTPHINKIMWGDDYLWDRTHFFEAWDEDYIDTVIIHGHTGCPMMRSYIWNEFPEDYNFSDPTILKYSNNHKIDIDLTSFITGKLGMINLDTLETVYFYENKVYNQYLEELKKYKESADYWA